MEKLFVVGSAELAAFLLALLAGLLEKSYRKNLNRMGYIMGFLLVMSYLALAYFFSPQQWYSCILWVLVGAACATPLLYLLRQLAGRNIVFSRFFLSSRANIIALEQMESHEVNYKGCTIRVLRPGQRIAKDYCESLNITSLAEASLAQGSVDFLNYTLNFLGGREVNPLEHVQCIFSVSQHANKNLWHFDDMRELVSAHILDIFIAARKARGNSHTREDKIVNFRINGEGAAYIRYKLQRANGHADEGCEYFHAPVSSDSMLTIVIKKSAYQAERIACANQFIDMLLSHWQIIPAATTAVAASGWQTQSWGEIARPPSPEDGPLSAADFKQLLAYYARDPLMWQLFERSANYPGWFKFQYKHFRGLFRSGSQVYIPLQWLQYKADAQCLDNDIASSGAEGCKNGAGYFAVAEAVDADKVCLRSRWELERDLLRSKQVSAADCFYTFGAEELAQDIDGASISASDRENFLSDIPLISSLDFVSFNEKFDLPAAKNPNNPVEREIQREIHKGYQQLKGASEECR